MTEAFQLSNELHAVFIAHVTVLDNEIIESRLTNSVGFKFGHPVAGVDSGLSICGFHAASLHKSTWRSAFGVIR